MPSLEKRIKTIDTTINKLIDVNDFSKNLDEYNNLKTEYTKIKNILDDIKEKIINPKDYINNDIDTFDDEKSYTDDFERLKEINEIINKDNSKLKIEKLTNLYLESMNIIELCDKKLKVKELNIQTL